MEHRDFLKDQIEQLGKALGKILADFLALKSRGEVTRGIEICGKQLNDQLDIDQNRLLSLDKNELKAFSADRQLTAEHIELLSEYMRQIGESLIESDRQSAMRYLKSALRFLETADETSNTMSFERIGKKEKIENALRKLGES